MATAFFSQLLLLIQSRIEEMVPEVRYVNQDLGQLEVYTMDRPAVSWPCLLIDMSDTNYADLMQGVQEANLCTIVVRLGFNPFSQTSNLQTEAVREKGLAYFEIEDKVYAALQGWDGGGLFSPLTRIRAVTEKREEDAFRVRVLIFTTAFEDDSASPAKETVDRPAIDLDAAFGED